MQTQSIGVFGGTFDPPHLGHLILASEAAQQLNLQKVLWVLAPDPPHKDSADITPLPHRLAMLERAAANQPRFEISRVEINRPGPHYTVDTLRLLKEEFPQAELTLLMGGDSLRDLPRWRDPAAIVNLVARLGVMRRPNAAARLDELEASLPGAAQKVHFITALMQELSSQELRRRAASGGEYRCYLAPAVYEYIEENRLYHLP
ncbi:MAG: nicotinate-nucleotide adenylyltransferase [Anaerolineales bacterium]